MNYKLRDPIDAILYTGENFEEVKAWLSKFKVRCYSFGTRFHAIGIYACTFIELYTDTYIYVFENNEQETEFRTFYKDEFERYYEEVK